MKRVLCLLMVVTFGACAPAWQKPGASHEDYKAAKADCTYHAAEHYPPVLRQTVRTGAYSTPSHAGCFGSPALADCLRAQSVMMPPSFETADDNEKPRDQFFQSCMKKKGWRPAD